MTAKEFRELGYLLELNRQFLHPLGLALGTRTEDDGSETLFIVDSRYDSEGIRYDSFDRTDVDKAAHIANEWRERVRIRRRALGYIVQPLR